MKRVLTLWAVLVAISALALYTPEKEVDLRIGVIKSVDTVHPYIAARQGYYEAEGLTYKIYAFGTSPALAEALAAGEIDLAYMSFPPTSVWISKGTKMKIVAGASRGGDVVCAREWNATGTIAVSRKGTMTENVYRAIVEENTPFKPLYGIEPADMPTALLITRDVDAVLTWEPFASKIEEAGGVCIFDAGLEWEKRYGERYQRNVLVATEKVYTNKTLLDKVLRAHNKAIEFLNTPGAGTVVAEVMGIAPLKKKRVEYTSELDWPSMERMMEIAKEEGYLKRKLAYDELVYEG